jgi:hypothetical protein
MDGATRFLAMRFGGNGVSERVYLDINMENADQLNPSPWFLIPRSPALEPSLKKKTPVIKVARFPALIVRSAVLFMYPSYCVITPFIAPFGVLPLFALGPRPTEPNKALPLQLSQQVADHIAADARTGVPNQRSQSHRKNRWHRPAFSPRADFIYPPLNSLLA